MCNTADDPMISLDFDSLFGPAPTSTENTSITEDVDQNLSLQECLEELSIQNERTAETIDYKSEYLKVLGCLEEKSKEHDQTRREHDQTRRDYDQLKIQLRKAMNDYVELHYESKKHALEAIEATTNLEKVTEDLKKSQHKMTEMEQQFSVNNTLYQAAMSHNKQLSILVEKLEDEISKSKGTNQSYKEERKGDKRRYSSLKNKLKTYEEDLCSIARKLDRATEKKNRDRETQRQITKYTKKKLNSDVESIDSGSVDTGRGSSFSFYSPAYSINFSPQNFTENFEHKLMKDASTSPLQTNETCDISELSITSPSFDVRIRALENKSVDVNTSKENIKTVNTAVYSPIYVANPSSPVPVSLSWESAASSIFTPLKYADVKIPAIEITDITRPLEPTPVTNPVVQTPERTRLFKPAAVENPVVKTPQITRPFEHAAMTSPVVQIPEITRPFKPADVTSPLVQTPEITRPFKHAAMTSPVVQIPEITRPFKPADVTSPLVQTPEITRPFKPADVTIPLVQTPEITRPFKPAAVTSPVVQIPEITRPFKPADVTSPLVQTPEITRPFKHAAMTSPVVQIPEITRPFKPADVTSPLVQTPEITRPFKPADVTIPLVQTPEITRPFKPAAVTSPVVQTPEMTRLFKPAAVTSPVAQTPEITRPLQSADVVERSTDKTPEMYRSLDPTVAPRSTVKIPEMTMQLKVTAVTKHADLLTEPNETNDVKRQSVKPKVSEMARHFETTDFVNQEAKTTTSEHVITLENNYLSVISKTPNLTQLRNAINVRRSLIQSPSRSKHAAARGPLIKTQTPDKTKQNEHIKIFSSEKSLTKNFIEIQSPVAQDNNKEIDDDLEVRMIFDKFRLDWNALSPMSITPDLDEEGVVQSESDVRYDGTERQSPEHSRSQISIESDFLLVTPDYKRLPIPQNQSETLKHNNNEDNPSHLHNNKVLKLHSITPIGHTPVYNENESQSNKTIYLRKRKTPVKIYENSTQSNNIMPQSFSELASNISSLESQSDLHNIRYSESNSLSRSLRNHMTQSQEPIKKEYLLKENRIDSIVSKPPERRTPERIKATSPMAQSKTKSVPQTQTKLQSSPIDNMSILKEPQLYTPKPPERRRSERIKFTIPAAQSKTKSVPQTQTKLQSSLIDNMSISKEPQSIMHISPERRRSERIKSTIPAPQSKSKSVPQTQTKLQSSPIDNKSISKEPQYNTRVPPEMRRSEMITSTTPTAQSKRKSVPQTRMKLQSSPIDNMSISKESQSNTRVLPEMRRSEMIKSTTPTAQSKRNSVPQTQMKLQSSPIDNMSISKEPQSNTRVLPEMKRSEMIKSTTPTAQSKRNSVPQTQMKLQSSPIDNMSISKEPQSNTRVLPEMRRSEMIKSTTPTAQSKRNSVPQTRIKLQSSPIDNMSISKESQSNTRVLPEMRRSEMIKSTTPTAQSKRSSVPQTRMKLQSSPINNMSISKEPQSNTRVPPEIRRSERIKSTTPTAQSKRNIVPQAQMKLQLSPIDNMSISKEPQSNTHSSCASIISNPEYGRKRTICRSMEAQSDNKHSKHQKSSECEAKDLSFSEICSEDKFTCSKSRTKRISRVKGSVSANTKSVPNNKESENISGREATETINKDLSRTPALKRANLADDKTTPASKRANLADDKTGFLIKLGQNTNENDNIKMSITHASTNTKNYPMAISEQSQNGNGRYCADYSDIDIFNTHNNTNENDNIKMSITHASTNTKNYPMAISEQSQNGNRRYCADYSDIEIFNTHNNNLQTAMQVYKGYEFNTHNQLDEKTVKYGSKRKNINKSKYTYQIAKEIEKSVAKCVNVSANPNKYSETLHEAAAELQKYSDISIITRGLYRYLNSRDRKKEFVPDNRNRNYRLKPTPTKYCTSLMIIIDIVDKNGLKLWDCVLNTCRTMIFCLNKAAVKCFDVVESVTHLFVNMCQYDGRRNSKFIILFILGTMYCANYRALIIAKECLDLVPEILPHECQKGKILYSMNPLLQMLIFLLYFYNCKDQFGKVGKLRITLRRRYGYDPTQENFDTILSKVKQTILEINDQFLDNAMLQCAILLLAKRKGTMWCHKNIVQKIISPIIRGQIYASKEAFQFCLNIILKLIKPYRKGMSVHCEEVVNLVMDIIEQPHIPLEMKEEILCDLLNSNLEHVIDRMNKFLDTWTPTSMSPKLETALAKYFFSGKFFKDDEVSPNMSRLHPY